MNFNSLYTLRYRQGSIGVSTGYLVASSLDKAEEVGKAWCAQEAFRKYIGVSAAVLADESILNEPQPAVSASTAPIPPQVEVSRAVSKARPS